MLTGRRLGHARLETPDFDRAIAYYTEVNGLLLSARDKHRAFLASEVGLLGVVVEQGQAERLRRLSFGIAAGAGFAEVQRRLSARGLASTR